MKVDMVMPQMGESIAEATISKWLKQVGDTVKKDEIILEISTDKVDSEIPAPDSGTLTELLFNEGDVVPVKEKIAVIDTEGGSASAGESSADSSSDSESRSESESESESASQMSAESSGGGMQTAQSSPAPQQQPSSVATSNGNGAHGGAQASSSHSSSGKFYSPLVRSLASKHGVNLEELDNVPGSGQGGRLTKQDFLNYLDNRGAGQQASQPEVMPAQSSSSQAGSSQTSPSPQPAPAPAEYKAPTPDMPTGEWGPDGTKVVPMDNMRQLIADHMVRSKHTSPHVYSVQEVDCSQISKWRARHKAEFKKKEGFNLSFTPFFLEAAVRGLLQFPNINASVDGNKVILKRHINLGCAVALGNTGLIVPVIKQAEERNLVGLARSLNDLALRARNKKLLPDEVMGGTFTVTNPGVFGTMIGTPIINQPQLAILCLGAIKKRPVVVDDMIAIREICYLTLSYDHRVVDGALGGQYLAFVREYLENWDMDRPLY